MYLQKIKATNNLKWVSKNYDTTRQYRNTMSILIATARTAVERHPQPLVFLLEQEPQLCTN
jgi:hypothetical protein